MPTLNIPQTISVTPEKYVNACSSSEIIELSLLLNSKRFDSCFENYGISDYSDEFRKVSQRNSDYSADSIKQMFGENAVEAVQIMNEICETSSVEIAEIIPLMRAFQKLERLRVKALVNNPQLQITKTEL